MVKNWKLRRKYEGHREWDNTKSNVSLTFHHSKGNVYVSLLGRGRYQAEYLVGGNSRKHVASAAVARMYDFERVTVAEAKRIAFNYMKTHPNG